MLDSLLSIIAFVAIGMACFGLGRPILRGLGIDPTDRLSVGVWSVTLGLIAAGLLLLTLGLLGVLYGPLIGVMTVMACFWGLGEILRGCLQANDWSQAPFADGSIHGADDADDPPWEPPATWLRRGILLAAAVACLGSLGGALAPPTAGDALCYHLELPKTFLQQHAVVHLPYHDNATFPLLAEMWFLWGLALDGGVCAQLIHWGLGVLLGLATVVLATPVIGRPWAWVAGSLVLLTPGVNNQMTAPLNDVALAVLTTLALAAWWRAIVNDGGRRWFVVAGLCGGAALGTKYIAMVFAAAVGVTWLVALVARRHQRRLLLQGAAIVAVVALSTGGIWYARAAWHRGNPVFPFLGEVFANADTNIDSDTTPRAETLPKSKSPLDRSLTGLASAPWAITMHPAEFGGRGHQLGILMLAAAPGLLLARRLRGLGTLTAVAGVYFVLWFLLRQNVRFLLPVVPLLGVAVAWVWIELRRMPRPAGLLCTATFAAILAMMAMVPLARSRSQLAVAAGLQPRDDYLTEREPTYTAAAVANTLADPDAHILSQDLRAFYFDCRVTREQIYRRYTHYDESIADPAQFSRTLREAGFTHLLLAETAAGEGIEYEATLSRLADAQLATDAADELLVLTEYPFRDDEGAIRRYRLVMLREGGKGE